MRIQSPEEAALTAEAAVTVALVDALQNIVRSDLREVFPLVAETDDEVSAAIIANTAVQTALTGFVLEAPGLGMAMVDRTEVEHWLTACGPNGHR